MRKAIIMGGLAAAAAGAAAVATRKRADAVRQAPDPYPYERLAQDPVGSVDFVERPDGTRIRIVVAGSGPTVLLAHGIYMTAVEWNVITDLLLGRGYRVVSFDQRGHGRSTIGADGISTLSMASDYLAILEHLDAHDAVLVGHSMGGFLSIAAVLDVPGVAERLCGLILMSTFAGDVLRGAPQNRAQIPLIKSGALQAMVANDTIGTLFGASICGDTPSPAMVQVFLDTFRVADHRSLLPILQAFVVEDRGDRLREITVPTIVLCGRSDKTTPPWQSERLAASIPGADARWVDGVGHMLNWEDPDLVVDAVEALSPVPAP